MCEAQAHNNTPRSTTQRGRIASRPSLEFPPVTTPLPGYLRCGDSTTAGIGVPAVASSGAQCANALLSVWEQLELNNKIRMP